MPGDPAAAESANARTPSRLSAAGALKVTAGSRHITLKQKDFERYRSERARRGLKLPRGFQKVDAMEVV